MSVQVSRSEQQTGKPGREGWGEPVNDLAVEEGGGKG